MVQTLCFNSSFVYYSHNKLKQPLVAAVSSRRSLFRDPPLYGTSATKELTLSASALAVPQGKRNYHNRNLNPKYS